MKKETFIEKSQQFHGNKYDYSLVPEKINVNKEKVPIICPYHGKFEQIAYNHYRGLGCIFCGREMQRKKSAKTTESFTQDARRVHGDKFDYSKVEYKRAHDKITIICPYHGEFETQPNCHLNGNGCPKCRGDKIKEKQTLTTEQFIEMARRVHGDKYDYSKTEYVKDNTEVIITCLIHGDFIQVANCHKYGRGCPECAKIDRKENKLKGRDKFIEEAKEIHNGKYGYSKIDHRTLQDKTKIICPIHGEFEQIAKCHLKGHGCPKCQMSHGEKKIKDFLDNNNITYENEKRFESLEPFMAFDFYLPKYNLIIEFDGVQHYQPIRFTYSVTEEEANQNFEKSKERDNIKNQ